MRRVVLVLGLSVASVAAAEQYAYDASGRVARVTYDDGSSIEYVYDAAGNLIEQRAVGVAQPPPPPPPRPCGCAATGGGLAWAPALAALCCRALRRRRPRE